MRFSDLLNRLSEVQACGGLVSSALPHDLGQNPELQSAAALDQALTAGTCGFGPFQWLPIRGEKTSFLAAIVPTPAGQCFVKLEASGERLDALRDGFLAFTTSLRAGGQAP